MNAPDKFPKTPVAPGVYVPVKAPVKASVLRRQTTALMLAALRRATSSRAGKSGQVFLKEIRDARFGIMKSQAC